MTITTEPLAGLTIDELNHLTSSIGTDTITWSDSNYVADPFGTYRSPTTFGPNVSGVNTVLVAANGGTGYTYTTNTTSPWLNVSNGGTGSSPTMAVNPSGTIEIKGEDADIKINGKSMVTWMEAVEERLNILTPNPELEKDWDDLRRLGQRYRALEKKCKEKAQMWAALKKVQPKQL
jgi:hypothetical protein